MDSNLLVTMDGCTEVQIELERDTKKVLVLKSEIIEILDKDKIVVSAPIFQSKIFPLSLGERVFINFHKKDTGMYSFLGIVYNRDNKKNVPEVYIRQIGKMNKLQRRSFFRLPIVKNIVVTYSDDDMEYNVNGVTKDISGGGIRAISNDPIKLGEDVLVHIALGQSSLFIRAKVVRCRDISDSVEKYDLGLKFDDIDEQLRSKIVSFIFEKQRNLRKKGMI
ncbi:MAG: PilZ domain-containing protein [Firmicutes bacterium]|jgi:c-di-GMP-binding flagellar brake protein YcgR|nr:PilZ domain-containing protein [Bacillota bacterium]